MSDFDTSVSAKAARRLARLLDAENRDGWNPTDIDTFAGPFADKESEPEKARGGRKHQSIIERYLEPGTNTRPATPNLSPEEERELKDEIDMKKK